MAKILATYKTFCESKPIRLKEKPHIDGDDIIVFDVEIINLSGTPTRNGVIYPKEEFKKALERDDVKQRLRTGSLYGEYDHPIDPNNITRWMRQEMPFVTHKWNKFWFEGDKLFGECQTFTGNGNLLGHAIKGGELPSFSIRVLGDPKAENGTVVLKDILLSTIDWVRYPGNPTSYLTSTDKIKVANYLDDGFDYASRPIPTYTTKGESYTPIKIAKAESSNLLVNSDTEDLYSMGDGFFAVVEKVSTDRDKDIKKARSSTFGVW